MAVAPVPTPFIITVGADVQPVPPVLLTAIADMFDVIVDNVAVKGNKFVFVELDK